MNDTQSKLSFWVLAAIFVTAAATNANDYSFLVPRQDVRLETHQAVIDRSAPASARYHVLVPYLAEPAIRLLAPRMSYEVAFRRVYALYYLSALTVLFAALFWYLSVWFSDVQALAATLIVGSTIRIVLRQGEYLDLSSIPVSSIFSPASLLEPILIAAGLVLILNDRRWLLALLVAVASLNSEAALLLPLLYVLTRPFSRATLLVTAGYAAISAGILAGLRASLGSAAAIVEPADIWTMMINVMLFLGPVWLAVVFGVRRAPQFVRRSAIAVPLYLLAVALFGRNWDLRLLTPLYPLLLPLAMSALFAWPERSRMLPREGSR